MNLNWDPHKPKQRKKEKKTVKHCLAVALVWGLWGPHEPWLDEMDPPA